MLRAVIIDDELKGIKSLELLIEKFVPEVRIVAISTDPAKGMELINDYAPDIVFLDIQMPGITGFDLLKGLKNRDFHLVFTTAYSQYGLKALKENAVDYLLKPIGRSAIIETVERIRSRMQEPKAYPDLLEIVARLKELQDNRIILPTRTSIEYVVPGDILFIEAQSNYCIFKLKDQKEVTVYRSLKDYEEELCSPYPFFMRVHKSFIVNINYVVRMLRSDQGGSLVMSDHSMLPLSRQKRKEFLQLVNFLEDSPE